METLLPWIILLHAVGAVIAFGPTFVFPFIGAMGGAEPAHGNFALRVSNTISTKLVTPLAIFQGVSGFAIIGIAQRNPFAEPWLLISIVLYGIAIYVALGRQAPLLKQMIEMTSAPPPAGATGGPPPAFLAAVKQSRMNGGILSFLVLAILFLMVMKPTI